MTLEEQEHQTADNDLQNKNDGEKPYIYKLLTKDNKDLLAEFEKTSLKENRLRALRVARGN